MFRITSLRDWKVPEPVDQVEEGESPVAGEEGQVAAEHVRHIINN